MAPKPCLQTGVTARPGTIGQVIQETVEEIMNDSFKPFSQNDSRPLAQARALLALLAECYAQQIYGSIAVARVAGRDPAFPWHWWEELPDARALRRFREAHRGEIHRCLVAGLRFQAVQKILAGALTKVDGRQIAEEAGRRITMAAFMDSLQLDGR